MSDSLMPPNATAQERALSLTTARASEVPTPMRDLWNPLTCPLALLPWLAWTLSVETWNPDWPEITKRAVVEAAVDTARHKGTVAAVKGAIQALGAEVELVEWWQQDPAGIPHTFEVNIVVNDARTNLCPHSEDLANIWWEKVNTTVPIVKIPSWDGDLSAERLEETAGFGSHGLLSPSLPVAEVSYTASCYVKAGERTKCAIAFTTSSGAFRHTKFDLITGQVIGNDSGMNGKIEAVDGHPGWWRISATRTMLAQSTTKVRLQMLEVTSTSHSGVEGFGLWFTSVQLERGQIASGFIKTENDPVTRTDIQDALPSEINRTKPLRSHYEIQYGQGFAGAINVAGILRPAVFTRLDGTCSY